MAIRRQATLGGTELKVYSTDLEQFDLEDIHKVLDRIGRAAREEYEPALPDIGSIIKAIEYAAHHRKTRIRLEQLRPEAREAIERAEEYKRIEASGGKLVKNDVAGMIEGAAAKLSMGEK